MLTDDLDNYIKEKFKLIYAISMIYQTYLIGGAIRDIMLNKTPRDLDFVISSNDFVEVDSYIKKFIYKYNLSYTLNHFNGYKILYKGIEIDLWYTKDLFDSIEYNGDGLLYDIEHHQLISLTFDDFLINGPRIVNKTVDMNNKSNERLLKLQKFHEELKSKGM
ncbi:MAG: hypothetical protein IJ572_03735 [Bacilli bacterium]|nr:hypothetical protein [Bacilli bacterium]